MNRNQLEHDPTLDLSPDDLLPQPSEHINAIVRSGEAFSANGNMTAATTRYARNIELGELIQSGERAKSLIEAHGMKDETIAAELAPVIDRADTALTQLLINSTSLARYFAFGRSQNDGRDRFPPRQRAVQLELAGLTTFDGEDFFQAILEKWYRYDLRKWEPKRGKLANFLYPEAGYNEMVTNYAFGVSTELGREILQTSIVDHLFTHETTAGTAREDIENPLAPSFPSQVPMVWSENEHDEVSGGFILEPKHDVSYDATPEFEKLEDEEIAQDLIAQLETDRDKKIIRMYFGEEMTYEEIGSSLGLTGARVGQLKRRAVRLMREYARDMGYTAEFFNSAAPVDTGIEEAPRDSSDLPERDQA